MIQTVTATGQLNPAHQRSSRQPGFRYHQQNLYRVDFSPTWCTNGQLIEQWTFHLQGCRATGPGETLASARAAWKWPRAEAERSEALYQSKIGAKSDYGHRPAATLLSRGPGFIVRKPRFIPCAVFNLSSNYLLSTISFSFSLQFFSFPYELGVVN